MQKILSLALLGLLISPLVFAQKTITGRVTSGPGNEGLPGVSIVIKGTTSGTSTDATGRYQVAVPEDGQILVFSFIGYKTIEETIGNRTEISVILEEDVKSLEEIVVVGYGTSTRKEVTGAISSVNGANITSLNPVRIDQALQGQVAGVQISTASGSPGGGVNIRIRGVTTNGNNDPLLVVDGVPYSTDGLNALNPSDIESITVLKDATAAIYGVRAANGVILVTTKKGKRNTPTTVDFNGYYGIQETSRQISLLNAREFAVLKNETYGAGGLAHPFPNTQLGEGTDWQKEVFQTAPIQNYNLSVNGGGEKGSFSIGGSYLDQEGIIGGEKSGYRRYNARLNFTSDLSEKLTLQSLVLYTNERRSTLPENGIGSVLYNTINASPAAAVRIPEGRYTYLMEFNDIINPLAQMSNTFNQTNVNKLVGKEELTYTINNDFEISGIGGYSYAIVDSKSFSPLVWYGQGKAQNTALNENLDPKQREIATGVFLPEEANVSESRTTYMNYNFEAYLNYNHTFSGSHRVKATLGTAIYEDRADNVSGVAFGVPYNSWEYADISLVPNSLLNGTSSWQDFARLFSVFARAEYAYGSKYMLSGILRRDASTRFGQNNRFGYFPSVSAAWLISEEDFFSSATISNLKLRASHGVSGNDKIGNWRYRALLGGEGVYPFDDVLANGIAIGVAGNPDLKWETTAQSNIGFDLTAFGDRLNFATDYYVKKTSDLLFQPDISGIGGSYGPGQAPPFVNGGDIRNYGFEFAVGYADKIGKDFNFNVSYNLTTIRNEVVELPAGVEFLSGGDFGVGGVSATRMEVGYPMGYFFGFKTDGIFQTQQEIDESSVTQPDAKPGDLRFADVNGDGTINFGNNTDRTVIGSPIPKFTMGLSLGFNYRGIDFSTILYASVGNEILRNYERQQPMANNLVHNINRWTGPGTSNEVPRLTIEPTRNAVISDYFIEDGSFLRIRNMQLGYTLPSAWMKKAGVSKFRFYVAANNLFTFTRYKGFDPEFSNGGPLATGIDYGFYPQARTYMAGVNLNF